MKRFRLIGVALVLALGLSSVVTACGSSSSDDDATAAGTTNSSSSGSGGSIDVAFVCATPATDPFFAPIQEGAADAAGEIGVNLTYTGLGKDISPSIMAGLVESAVNTKPDAMVVCNFFPDAVDPEIERAVESGIPVVGTNGEQEAVENAGGVATVGTDSFSGGKELGEQLLEEGSEQPLCMNHVPSNPAVAARCEGLVEAYDEAGKEAEVLNLNEQDFSDPTAQKNAMKGALTSNKGIDGLVVLGAPVGPLAVEAVEEAGRSDEVLVGTWDISAEVIKQIEEGKISVAAWQQPYLMGALPVMLAAEYARHGFAPTSPVSSGPAFVTKDNVETAQQAVENGLG